MENSRLSWKFVYLVATILLLGTATQAQELTGDEAYVIGGDLSEDTDDPNSNSFEKRQDEGFSLLKYFFNNGNNQQQQQHSQPATTTNIGTSVVQQQQSGQIYQQPQTTQAHQQKRTQQYQQQYQLPVQQYHQQLQQKQQQPVHQYESRPQTYQQQQPIGLTSGGIVNLLGNNQNVAEEQPYGTSRTGPYVGPIKIGYKPEVSFGTMLSALPKIMKVLSAGGKVVMGVELGRNFYFGPVGVKPLHR